MKPESAQTILLAECSSFDRKGFDKDIDLYINLIADKKYKSAASVYRKRLVPRYPDEMTRIKIIRYYRKKDPRFSQVYAGAVQELLERIVFSVKKLIDYITGLLQTGTSDPYELLKRIEKALQVIPAGQEEGIYFLNKMDTYSMLLDYRVEKFSSASDILKRYFDNTLFVRVEAPKVKKEKEYQPPERKTGKNNKVTIDLDAVSFSEEELKSICIDSRIKEKAYQVLAFCRLYWKNIFNQDFEKKVFLYSRKYNSLHYKILLTIRNGRMRRTGDDVILLELYSLFSSRYQYSMQEDTLMQKIWRRIKPVEQTGVMKDAGKTHPAQVKADDGGVSAAGTAGKKSPVPEKIKPVEKSDRSEKKRPAPSPARSARPARPAPSPRPARAAGKTAVSPYNTVISLKEKLDGLCRGELFDAHKEFENLLPKYVERYLQNHKKPSASPAGDPYVQKGAQYIVMNYIKENSSSVPLNWNKSIERREVTNMGYEIPELDVIITTCLEEVRMRRAIVH